MEKLREKLERRRAIREQANQATERWRTAVGGLLSEAKGWLDRLASDGVLDLSIDEDDSGFPRLRISEPSGVCIVMESYTRRFVRLRHEPADTIHLEFLFLRDPDFVLLGGWRVAAPRKIEDDMIKELTTEERGKATRPREHEDYKFPDDPLEFVAQQDERLRSYVRKKMTYGEIGKRAQPLSESLFESMLLSFFS